MTRILLLRPDAEHDLIAARDWYDQRRTGLGDEFLDAVARALKQLESGGELQRIYYRNFRRVLVRRFPYRIFYQLIDERIIIFRVLHFRQEHRQI